MPPLLRHAAAITLYAARYDVACLTFDIAAATYVFLPLMSPVAATDVDTPYDASAAPAPC